MVVMRSVFFNISRTKWKRLQAVYLGHSYHKIAVIGLTFNVKLMDSRDKRQQNMKTGS